MADTDLYTVLTIGSTPAAPPPPGRPVALERAGPGYIHRTVCLSRAPWPLYGAAGKAPRGPRGSGDPAGDLRRQQNPRVRASWPRAGLAWGASLLDSPQPGRQQRMTAARVPQAPSSFAPDAVMERRAASTEDAPDARGPARPGDYRRRCRLQRNAPSPARPEAKRSSVEGPGTPSTSDWTSTTIGGASRNPPGTTKSGKRPAVISCKPPVSGI
jgi:hypothetical protein